MKLLILTLGLASILALPTNAKIMRNNALMSKMMSNFQKDNNLSTDEPEAKQDPEKVVTLMHGILCKHFPSIPCNIITADKTLNNLIERSIQQINYKKMAIDKTTQAPSLTLFPTINSEELSNFLKLRDSFKQKKHKRVQKEIEKKPQEYTKKIKRKETKRTSVYNGRKKLRKFYPHKVKYKDKSRAKDFGDYSEEKLSMSVETPESPVRGKQQHFSFKEDPAESVWRIDYAKHGEPSFNVVGHDERLRGKTGPNVIVDEVLEQSARKDVLHPDLYIKKKFVKKSVLDMHSEDID